MYFPIILVVVISGVLGDVVSDKLEDQRDLEKSRWLPLIPYGDRIKQIKKDSKDDKFYQNGFYGHYLPMPYLTGLYAGLYGFEGTPIYQVPISNPFLNGNLKKEKQ